MYFLLTNSAHFDAEVAIKLSLSSATRPNLLNNYFLLSLMFPNFLVSWTAHIPATQPTNVTNMSVATHNWHFGITFQLTRGVIYIFDHL